MIKIALKKYNNDFFVRKKLITYGPESGPKYQQIINLSDEGNQVMISNSRRSQTLTCSVILSCEIFVVNSQHHPKEKLMRETDVAHKYLLEEDVHKST